MRPAVRRQAALVGQQLDDDGGRGQRQAGADDDGGAAGLLPASAAMPAITDVRQDDLQAAQPEHQPAHGEQALVGQLQADQEQQEHDAELGDAGDVLGVDDGDPVEPGHLSLKEPRPSGPRTAPAPR